MDNDKNFGSTSKYVMEFAEYILSFFPKPKGWSHELNEL
jgi:hypothetical protein